MLWPLCIPDMSFVKGRNAAASAREKWEWRENLRGRHHGGPGARVDVRRGSQSITAGRKIMAEISVQLESDGHHFQVPHYGSHFRDFPSLSLPKLSLFPEKL